MPTTFRQSDPRWGNKIVGFGSGKYQSFAYVGCVVCALTYLYNHVTGRNITPDEFNSNLKKLGQYHATKNPKGAFIGALIVWSNIKWIYPELQFVYRDYNYNNARVWSWINITPRMPVIVEVYKSDSITRRHWVLYLGGQKMYDSILGKILSTSTRGYTPGTGSARFKKA